MNGGKLFVRAIWCWNMLKLPAVNAHVKANKLQKKANQAETGPCSSGFVRNFGP